MLVPVSGGSTTIAGTSCAGSVRKLNPDNGSSIWEHCMQAGPVLGSVTATSSGVVAASQGSTVIVMNASTGTTVARLTDNKSGSLLYAGPTISNGILFVGNLDGNLYAYSINGTQMANFGPAEDFMISSSQKNRTRDLQRSTYLTGTFKGGNVTVEVVDSREQYLDG